MAHYQVIIAYDGTLFEGFQRQAQARTVQGVIETALQRLGWNGSTILSAGRTDTGVHAAGQVIAFDLAWAHSPKDLCLALNSALPLDVSARSASEVEAVFHPRFSALGRRYQYRIYCQELRDPLKDRYAWRVWPAPDVLRLQTAAQAVIGTFDFAAFGAPPRPQGSTVRTVSNASWTSGGEGLTFEIAANAFLYHMVRRLVFLQIQVGQGRMSVEQLARGLACQEGQMPGLAPACGLVLAEVMYPPSGQRLPEVNAHGSMNQSLAASGDDDRGQDFRP